MPLGLHKFLSPTPERSAKHPAERAAPQADQWLNIAVVFTTVPATLAALKEAAELASHLGARITLIVPEVVPYAVPLEMPPVQVEFSENRFRVLAHASPVETNVQIFLCRDRLAALRFALKPGAIVILAGRKRWWPSKDQYLADQLLSAGYEVIFKETE